MDSDKAGILKAGTSVAVLETRRNEKGVLRVRFDQGWVSERAGDGKLCLEATAWEADDATPQPKQEEAQPGKGEVDVDKAKAEEGAAKVPMTEAEEEKQRKEEEKKLKRTMAKLAGDVSNIANEKREVIREEVQRTQQAKVEAAEAAAAQKADEQIARQEEFAARAERAAVEAEATRKAKAAEAEALKQTAAAEAAGRRQNLRRTAAGEEVAAGGEAVVEAPAPVDNAALRSKARGNRLRAIEKQAAGLEEERGRLMAEAAAAGDDMRLFSSNRAGAGFGDPGAATPRGGSSAEIDALRAENKKLEDLMVLCEAAEERQFQEYWAEKKAAAASAEDASREAAGREVSQLSFFSPSCT